VELPVETDQTIRRHYFHPRYTNMSWQAALVWGQVPAKREKVRWLNFYGPRDTIPGVSYYQVLEPGSLPTNFFAGKAVFVGEAPMITYQGAKGFDNHPTPHTRWTGQQLAGVELQATAFLNLIRREWLEELSALAELGWATLVGVFRWRSDASRHSVQ